MRDIALFMRWTYSPTIYMIECMHQMQVLNVMHGRTHSQSMFMQFRAITRLYFPATTFPWGDSPRNSQY